MRYSIHIVVAGIGLCVLDNHSSRAGAPYDGTAFGDVVVATVKEVSKDGTNGNPPRLRLEIHEVLRGDAKRDRTQAVWSPRPHDVDYGDTEKNPIVIKWKTVPLAGPKVGSKMILWGRLWPENDKPGAKLVFCVNPFHRYEFSDKRHAWAIEEIRAAEREAEENAKERAELKRIDRARSRPLLFE